MSVLTLVMVVGLLTLSGLFSGLTLGLMSLNPFALRRQVKMGNKDAKKIYPLRKHGTLLLTTLLLGNVAVNSALSIFLGSLTGGIVAAISATALIVVFGEIVPQAVFSRFALKLGARMVWLVYIFLFLLYPLAKPLSMVLDRVLGREMPTMYSKKEFHLFLEEQRKLKNSDIDEDEFDMLQSGLVFSDKAVKDVMTPLTHAFLIEQDIVLSKQKLVELKAKGHSRIPVYDLQRKKIVGLLYAKDLVGVSPRSKLLVNEVMRRNIRVIRETARLDTVLSLFKKNHIHLFVVTDWFRKVVGIITMEDVLEEIVGEIADEYDRIGDMRRLK